MISKTKSELFTSAAQTLAAAIFLLGSSAAIAQDSGKNRPILEAKPDRFGVDMASGSYINSSPFSFKGPGAGHLVFRSSFNGRKLTFSLNHYLSDNTYTPAYDSGNPERHIKVHLGGVDKLFRCTGMVCSPSIENDGSILTKETQNRFVYRDKDGTTYTFQDQIVIPLSTPCYPDEFDTCNAAGYFAEAGISTIEYPNGEKLIFSPVSIAQTLNNVCYASDVISSNLGYSLSISRPAPCNYTAPASMKPGSQWIGYGYNGITPTGSSRVTWLYGASILGTLINTFTWTNGYIDGTSIQQDDLGRVFQTFYHIDDLPMCNVPNGVDRTYIKPVAVVSPAGVRTDITYYTTVQPVPVKTIAKAGRTWHYDNRTGGRTVTQPSGDSLSVTTVPYGDNYSYGNLVGCNYGLLGYRITQETNGLNNSNSYAYDNSYLTSASLPEGNSEVYSYDTRHNLTRITKKPKPGSGLSDIVQFEANFDSTCANPKKCNQPNWTRDANGNQTDYTYDTIHGGTLVITLPADRNGIRLRTFNTYAAFNTGNGTIYRITRSEKCGLSSGQLALTSCPATTQTAVLITSYGDSGTAPNTYKSFLPYSVTQTDGAGSLSATTTYTYDVAGRVIATDGPRTDVNDVSYITYDAVGRKVFEIGVDPDGSGPLPRQMVKHTYDADDRVTRQDFGYGNSVNGSDFEVSRFIRNTYDNSTGLLIKAEKGQP